MYMATLANYKDQVGQSDPSLDAYFESFRVEDALLIDACQSLRYQVYCLERCFLDPQHYPDAKEVDNYDPQAWHFATLSKTTKEIAGTVRIVPFIRDIGLPLTQHCQMVRELDPRTTAREFGGQDKIAEISRLAISRNFRRRQFDDIYGDSHQPIPNGAMQRLERRATPRPLIVLGLYAAYYRECKIQGITRWYAAMDPALVRLLARFGIHLTRIGPDSDYYGKVAPYSAKIEQMEQALFHDNPSLLREFAEGLSPNLRPPQLSGS